MILKQLNNGHRCGEASQPVDNIIVCNRYVIPNDFPNVEPVREEEFF